MRKIVISILTVLMSLSMLCFFACKKDNDPNKKPQGLASQTSVTDFSVSTEGVIGFTEETGTTYTLLIDGASTVRVKSGDDVSEILGSGNSVLAVEKDAKDGYKKSEPSNTVKVSKPQAIALSVADMKLDFDSESGKTYKLSVVGRSIGDVNATDNLDLTDYVEHGANEILVKCEGNVGSDGTVNLSAKSNSVNLYLHDKVNAKITPDGKINFEEKHGYTYLLTLGDDQVAITDKMDITELLNKMSAGNNPASITVTGKTVENNVYSVLENDEVTTFAINKHQTPSNVKVTNTNRIVFDSQTTAVDLYVNQEYKGKVYYGDSLYKYYNGKNNSISVKSAGDDKGWTSDMSETVSVTMDKYLIASFTEQTAKTQLKQTKDGITVIGGEGTTVTFSEKISLKDISATDYLIAMKPTETGSACGIERVRVKLVDAYDSSKGIELVMVNGRIIGAGNGTYFGGGKLGKVNDYSQYSYTPATNVLATFSEKEADFRFKYNVEQSKFTIELKAQAGNFDYDIKSAFGLEENENPFSEENKNLEVYLSVEYTALEWESGFAFSCVAGYNFSVAEEDKIKSDNDGNWLWGSVIAG